MIHGGTATAIVDSELVELNGKYVSVTFDDLTSVLSFFLSSFRSFFPSGIIGRLIESLSVETEDLDMS